MSFCNDACVNVMVSVPVFVLSDKTIIALHILHLSIGTVVFIKEGIKVEHTDSKTVANDPTSKV